MSNDLRRLGPFLLLDHGFIILTDRADLAAWAECALGHLQVDEQAAPRPIVTYSLLHSAAGWDLAADGRRFWAGQADAAVLPRLMVVLNRAVVASTTEHLLLHGAVIARGEDVRLLVGEPGRGKSTLAAIASHEGWAYGGDEHVAVDFSDGRVVPVVKPLSLKRGSMHLFPDAAPDPELAALLSDQWLLAPTSLPGGLVSRPVTISRIVLPRFEPSRRPGEVLLGGAEATMALRSQTFNFGVSPTRALETLAAMVRAAPTVRTRFQHGASALNA